MTSSLAEYRIRPEYPYFNVEVKSEGQDWEWVYKKWFFGLFTSKEYEYTDVVHWSMVRYYKSGYGMMAAHFKTYEEALAFVKERMEKDKKDAAKMEEEKRKADLFPKEVTYFNPNKTSLHQIMNNEAMAREKNPVGSMFLHVKTGKRYVIQGYSVRESDLALMVQYREIDIKGTIQGSVAYNVVWSRPYEEFKDGRFMEEAK